MKRYARLQHVRRSPDGVFDEASPKECAEIWDCPADGTVEQYWGQYGEWMEIASDDDPRGLVFDPADSTWRERLLADRFADLEEAREERLFDLEGNSEHELNKIKDAFAGNKHYFKTRIKERKQELKGRKDGGTPDPQFIADQEMILDQAEVLVDAMLSATTFEELEDCDVGHADWEAPIKKPKKDKLTKPPKEGHNPVVNR